MSDGIPGLQGEGEHLHGDHSQTGSNHSRQTHHQQIRNDYPSQMAPGSTRAHGKPVRSSKRAHLTTANFFDDDSQNVEDIYGDDMDDVYNNIN